MMQIQVLKDELEALLQTVLPDATLKAAELPGCNGLKLYLIDEQYSLDALDAAAQQRVMNNPLYWMFCWASGHAMAELIIQGGLDVKGLRVLDFGSGSGVVAIAAALAGADLVIASDIDPFSQQAIALNAHLNQCADRLHIIGDYKNIHSLNANKSMQADKGLDLITMADVLYDSENTPLIDELLPLAKRLCLADSRVNDFTHARFDEVAQHPGETFPPLGGFDEFSMVKIFMSK